jgi:hypothetical protein
MFSSSAITVTVAFIVATTNLLAQESCVNYDSRYPITTSTGKQYLWNPLWNFSPMKMEKVSGLNIGGDGFFNGMLQYIPAGYHNSSNASKKYPLIISFHGGAARGNGSALELCRLFKDRGGDSAGHKTFPGRVERNTPHLTQTYNGVTYEYIVVAPQFNKYIWGEPGVPDQFPTAKQVENVIDFAVQRFRIDPRRIYLIGYSTGANMIIEYAGSSVARAKRVAAIMPVAVCSQLGHTSNTSRGVFAKNIGLARLKTWFVYCETDNCGKGPALRVADKWVDSIMKVPGAAPPRYTRLRNADPPHLYNCSDSLLHDAWSRAFDPNFRISHDYNSGNATAINDGINLNMYEWFIRQTHTQTPDNPTPPDDTTLPVDPPPPDNPDTTDQPTPVDPEPPGDPDPPVTPPPPGMGLDSLPDTLEESVQFIPNPFFGRILARLKLTKRQKISISILDITGRVIKTYSGNHSAGNSQVEMFVSSPPAGIYFIRFEGKDFLRTAKMLKK